MSWRFPFAFQILFLLVVVATILSLPESPRWLVKKNRILEAREVLAVLKDVPVDDELVNQDIAIMQRSLAINAGRKGSLRHLIRNGDQRIFNRAIIAILGQLFQQWNGVALTVAYAVTIYEQYLGFDGVKSRGLAIAMESLLIVGGAGTVVSVDRFGRRPLMLLSAAVMAICMAAVAGTTAHPGNTGALYAAVFFLFLYAPFFSLGFLSLTNLYATEVAPLEFRAAIAGCSTAASWLSNFVIVLITPVAFNSIGYRYWIVYAVINAAIVPTIYFLFPETTGLSLEEMDEVFGQSKNFLDPPKIAREMTKRRAVAENGVESAKTEHDQ